MFPMLVCPAQALPQLQSVYANIAEQTRDPPLRHSLCRYSVELLHELNHDTAFPIRQLL